MRFRRCSTFCQTVSCNLITKLTGKSSFRCPAFQLLDTKDSSVFILFTRIAVETSKIIMISESVVDKLFYKKQRPIMPVTTECSSRYVNIKILKVDNSRWSGNGDLVLGGHLNDAGLVDDACGLIALLNDADDPGLVALLLLDVLAISSGLLSRQADQ